MTNTYPATNLQLQFDDNTGEWSYTEAAYDYRMSQPPTWSGYTTTDPDFEFAPDAPDTDPPDQDPCPEGYIYDNTLKQCVPDPDYNPRSFQNEPTGGGGGGEPTTDNYVSFRDMSYPDMIQYGQEKGYFNNAGTYIGEQDKGFLSFGKHMHADRYAKQLAQKGGKIWNPNETSLVGNLYIPKNDDLAKFIAGVDTWSNYATNVTSVKDIGQENIATVQGKTLDQIQQEIAEEKLKQEKIKTQQKENEITDDSGTGDSGTGDSGSGDSGSGDSGSGDSGSGTYQGDGYSAPGSGTQQNQPGSVPNPHTQTGFSGGQSYGTSYAVGSPSPHGSTPKKSKYTFKGK